MADTKNRARIRSGPFELGQKFDEVGPELGHFHVSRHVATGQPAVTLRPGDRMHWLHRGPWRLVISCEHDSPDVSLRLDQAPPFAPPGQVADLLVLMSAAFQRVEDSPRLLAHLAGGLVRTRWARQAPRFLVGAAVLALGLGVWCLATGEGPRSVRPRAALERARDAPALIHTANLSGPAISYPLPSEPFRNQKKAPCNTRHQLEVELKGGCWVALEQKPPCAEDRAEHEGKCYLPVAKDPGRPPQSAGP